MAKKTDIRLRRSNVANAIPGAANLSDGELAMNTMDGALYFKKSDGTIITAHDNTIMHVDSGNDRIGIGTTSPSYDLDVSGNIHATATYIDGYIYHTGDSDTYINYSTDTIILSAGAQQTYFKGNGNVGINISNPARKFVVRDAGAQMSLLSDTDGSSVINFGDTADDNAGRIHYNNNTDAMFIRTATVDRIAILSSGFVGIGDTTPSRQLEVGFAGSTYGARFTRTDAAGNSLIEFANNQGVKNVIGFDSGNSGFIVSTGGTPHVTVRNSSGNVGIGDTNPAHPLTVSSANNTTAVGIDIGSNATYNFEADSTSGYTTTFNMDNTGLEIGHDSTSRNLALQTGGLDRLTIGGGGSTHVHGNLDVSGADVTITANIIHAGDTDTYFGFHGNNLWRVVTGGSERFEISNSGFRFNENGADMDFTVESANNANAFFIQGSDGAVGIGTSTPTEKLHVAGGARFNSLVKLYTNPGSTYGVSEALRIDNAGGNTDRQFQIYETLHSGVREHIIGYNTDITTDGSSAYTYTQGNYGGSSAIRFGNSGQIQFFSDAQVTSGSTDTFTPTEVVRFAQNGRVGIGTTNPSHRFHVLGSSTNQTAVTKIQRVQASASNNTYTFEVDSSAHTSNMTSGGAMAVDVNGGRAFTINGMGSVGIGTSSPSFKLHVDSGTTDIAAQFKSSDNKAAILISDDDSNTYVSAEGSTSSIGVNAGRHADNLNILSTGAVGIGTTSPSEKLHVKGTNASIAIDGNGSSNTASIKFINDNERSRITSAYDTGGGGRLTFHTDTTGGSLIERMRIDNAGNVGIGTTPTHKLHVNGQAKFEGAITAVVTSGGGAALSINHTGNENWSFDARSGSGSMDYVDFGIAGGTRAMTWQEDGNVGIGNTNPGVPLDVNSNSSAQGIRVRGRSTDDIGQIDLANNGGTVRSQLQWNNSFFNIKALAAIPMIFYTNGTERMRIQSAGQVGIGTTSPEGTLHVKSTGNGEIDIERDSGAKINIQAQSAAGYIGTDTNHVFGLKANSTVRLKIATNGAITFNDAFTFPTSIGSAGQVLKVPSSGTELVWASDAGGGSATVLTDTDGDTKIQVEESADEDIIRFDIAGTQKMLLNSTELNLTGDLAVSGNLNIVGDINSTSVTNLDVTDKTITVANNAGSAANANGAGIVVDTGTNNPQMIYGSTTDEWDFNRSIHVSGAAGSGVKINSGNAIVGGGASGGDTQLMYWGGTVVYYGRSSLGGTVSGHEFRIGGVTKLNVKSTGNVELAGNMIIKDTAGTRGIFRDNDAYDLRLGGGVDMSDGAFISLGGENRGGSTSSARGKVEIRSGGNAFASQADVLGDIVIGTSWNGGTDNIIIVDSSSGKVGIGTSTPSKKLHIKDSASHQLQLQGSNSYWNVGTGWSGYYQDYFLVANNSGEKLVIDTNGNVGIGTNGPTAKLTVVNNGTTDALLLTSHEDSNSAAPVLVFKRTSSSVADADYLGQLKFKGENDADQEVVYAKITAKIQDASDGTEDGLLEFANVKAGSNNIGMRLRSDSLQLLNGTNLKIADDASQMQFGSGNDMQIFHNGANGEISNATGNFTIDSVGDIILDADGADVILQDGGTEFGRFTQLIGGLAIGAGSPGGSYPMLLSSNKVLIFTDMQLGDDEKIIIGDGATGNLQIFHDGTNSYLDDVAEGDLILRTNGTNVKMMSGSETMVNAAKDGAVTLYHNNAAKLATTSTGIDVTGTVTSDGLTSSGNLTFSPSGDYYAGLGSTNALHFENSSGQTLMSTASVNIRIDANNSDTNRFFSVSHNSSSNATSSGTNLFRVQEDGKVGVGTSSPAGKFHISGNSDLGDEDCMLIIDDVDGSAGSRIPAIMFRSNTGGTVTNQARIRGTDTSGLVLSGSSSLGNDLVVRSTGVGIGITSPGAALHIGNAGHLLFERGGEVRSKDTSGTIKTIARVNSSNELEYGWSGSGAVKFMGGGSYSERMRVHTNGNIAINQTAAPHTLTVKGTISRVNSSGIQIINLQSNSDAGQIAINNSGGTQKVKLDSAGGSWFTGGSVGIGTNAPQNTLHVDGTLRVGPYFATSDRDHFLVTPGGTVTTVSTPNENAHYDNSAGNIHIRTNTGYNTPVERLTVTSAGNVGIGNTSPDAKLQVEELGIDTTTTTTSATTQVTLASLDITDFRSARFTIQISNTTDSTYHTTEILAVHDGTTANITEFGEVHTGSSVEATFDAAITSGFFRLQATPASTDTMVFKVVSYAITV